MREKMNSTQSKSNLSSFKFTETLGTGSRVFKNTELMFHLPEVGVRLKKVIDLLLDFRKESFEEFCLKIVALNISILCVFAFW